MPAKKEDLIVEQGVDWSHGWAVTVNGEPIDDTWTVRAQIRTEKSGPASLLIHEFAADVTAEGAVVIAVTPDESSAWSGWTSAPYDVEITNADQSLKLRVAQGFITVDREVTQ